MTAVNSIRVTFEADGDWSSAQHAFGKRVAERLEQALNHESFRKSVLAASYSASWMRDAQGMNHSVSATEVYEAIAHGLELGTGKDLEIDLKVRLGFSRRWRRRWRRRVFNKVLGSTSIGGPVITTNGYYFEDARDDGDVADLAGHWMHEWMHVAGFYHHGGNRARGDVAYVIGQIVERIVDELDD